MLCFKESSVQIGSISDFLEKISLDVSFTMYRGQANSNWPLIPSIGRLKDNLEHDDFNFHSWEQLEAHLLNDFKRSSTPFMDFVPTSKLEWLVHAQHHGMPTRLLDWTSNPLKALFFAIENPSFDDTDSIVYELAPAGWHNDTDGLDELNILIPFYPRHLNSRIMAQEGCFTAFPYPNKFTNMLSLRDKGTSIST